MIGHLADLLGKGAHFWWIFHTKCDIFRNAQGAKKTKVLKHHRDASGACCAWFVWRKRLAVQHHLARIRCNKAVDHFDQCRFPRPIFTEQSMNFAAGDCQAHVFVGDHAGIGFG